MSSCPSGGIISLFSLLSLTLGGELRDYCLHESLNASCRSGDVILMTSARYGRMRAGRCISSDYGHMGCSSSVIGYLDRMCSGRSACSVNVRDLVDVRPCRKDFMLYLEAQYECITVPSLDVTCPEEEKVQAIRGMSGYLTSYGMTSSPLGSASCPWLIQAGPGQQINFTFIDFYRDKMSDSLNNGMKVFNPCTVTIIYAELGARHEINICGKKSRETHLFTSKSNLVTLEISLTASSGKMDFLIQFKVIGCSDPVLNGNMWLHRNGDNAVVKCNRSDEIWYLMCQGTAWIGEVGNCSFDRPTQPQTISGYFFNENKGIHSHAMVLAVLIGVVLGVFIGASMLILVHRFRRKLGKEPRDNSLPLMRPRENTEPLDYSKDLEGSYPALLENVEGEGQTLKHYFEDPRHYCHGATFATCDHVHDNHTYHKHTFTTSFNDKDTDYISTYLDNDTMNSEEIVGSTDSPYPPGMRTPQSRETASDYLSSNISIGCLNHGHSCTNSLQTDKHNIACLPDSSFD